MEPSDNELTAAELKAQGNTFFLQKNYDAAVDKYTEALKLDPSNAVLYCNRSACRYGQKRYFDAREDAQKAISLDPTYIKAHSRLASAYDAMDEYTKSIESWERAIELLPKGEANSADAKLRETYTANLKTARERKDKPIPNAPFLVVNGSQGEKMPWDLAEPLIPQLRAESNPHSSAWVIHAAYEEFKEAMKVIQSLKSISTPQGPAMSGRIGGIEYLSNAILRDERVFHMTDNQFVGSYNKQVQFETQKHRAWVEGGPEDVIKQAVSRLQTEGWSSVRPALSVSVRARFLRGFLGTGMKGRADMGVELIGHAIKIIELGLKEWPNVPDEERGVIFNQTFIIGLRAAWLQQRMEDCSRSGFKTLETLRTDAEKLVIDVKASQPNLPQNVDPGFIYSFYSCPLGRGHSILGYYYRHVSDSARASGNMEEAHEQHMKAHIHYEQAASNYPPDDEQHLWFLKCALDCLLNLGAPVKYSLPIMRRIKETYPNMKRIWAFSSLAKQGRDQRLEQTIALERRVTEMLAQGILSMNDPLDHAVAAM